MVQEAVTNLLDNARIHGGPTLTEICLSATRTGDTIAIEVSDDGKGISPEEHDHALKRFEQLGSTSGSGLGLSIVEAVAHAHGGTCTLHSRDRGLTARITLLAQDEAD
ncbi:MAG: sensor histidine kinase, partial [Pseudomonadota bacterium]